MAKKRINQNFYTIDGLKHQRITQKDREEMDAEISDYWRDLDYWYVKKELPDGRLFAGWGVKHPTKLTKDDLPPDYVEVINYKKHGYIRTAGVKGLIYNPSLDPDHAIKDDYLYISYTDAPRDEYLWGWDIITFINAMDKWSPEYDTSRIKRMIVERYNAYCDGDKINSWEDLANGTRSTVRSDN